MLSLSKWHFSISSNPKPIQTITWKSVDCSSDVLWMNLISGGMTKNQGADYVTHTFIGVEVVCMYAQLCITGHNNYTLFYR